MSSLEDSLYVLARHIPTTVRKDLPPMLVVSEENAASPGAVLSAGMLTKTDSTAFQRSKRVLGKFAIVYLLEGEGAFSHGNDAERRVRAGDVLVLFPDIPHAYGPPAGGHWRELYIIFSGAAFDLWRARGVIDPHVPVLRAAPVSKWLSSFRETLPLRCPADHAGGIEAACRLLAVLTRLRANVEGRLHHPPLWLDKSRQQLAQLDGPDVRRIARDAGISYDAFRKRFSDLTGYAPMRYRLLRRIEEACRLIREENAPFKEIADRLAFADEFHFAKRFKNVTGLTPGEFRSRAGPAS